MVDFDFKKIYNSVRMLKIIYRFFIFLVFISNLFSGVRGELKVIFLNVGQGSCQIIKTPSGNLIIIDGGTDESSGTIIKKLNEIGIKNNNRIEAIILSNPQSYNVGGFIEILDRYDIGNIYDPGMHFAVYHYESFLEKIMMIQDKLAEEKGAQSEKRLSDILSAKNHFEYFNLKAGDVLNFDPDIEAYVLSPKKLYYNTRSDPNNNSLVLKITYGKVSFLFTGDIEERAERDLLSYGTKLNSTVMKIPNFGSSYSSSKNFVKLVSPKIGILSVGKNNPYGYPSTDVLLTYKNLGVKIYRTDLTGTIEITTDGLNLRVKPEIETEEATIIAQFYEKLAEEENPQQYIKTVKLNINKATADELLNLPELGPVKAQMIIKYRNTYGNFNSIDDLLKVPGINKFILEQIKDKITIE